MKFVVFQRDILRVAKHLHVNVRVLDNYRSLRLP
jgi:hypothetical protein